MIQTTPSVICQIMSNLKHENQISSKGAFKYLSGIRKLCSCYSKSEKRVDTLRMDRRLFGRRIQMNSVLSKMAMWYIYPNSVSANLPFHQHVVELQLARLTVRQLNHNLLISKVLYLCFLRGLCLARRTQRKRWVALSLRLNLLLSMVMLGEAALIPWHQDRAALLPSPTSTVNASRRRYWDMELWNPGRCATLLGSLSPEIALFGTMKHMPLPPSLGVVLTWFSTYLFQLT